MATLLPHYKQSAVLALWKRREMEARIVEPDSRTSSEQDIMEDTAHEEKGDHEVHRRYNPMVSLSQARAISSINKKNVVLTMHDPPALQSWRKQMPQVMEVETASNTSSSSASSPLVEQLSQLESQTPTQATAIENDSKTEQERMDIPFDEEYPFIGTISEDDEDPSKITRLTKKLECFRVSSKSDYPNQTHDNTSHSHLSSSGGTSSKSHLSSSVQSDDPTIVLDNRTYLTLNSFKSRKMPPRSSNANTAQVQPKTTQEQDNLATQPPNRNILVNNKELTTATENAQRSSASACNLAKRHDAIMLRRLAQKMGDEDLVQKLEQELQIEEPEFEPLLSDSGDMDDDLNSICTSSSNELQEMLAPEIQQQFETLEHYLLQDDDDDEDDSADDHCHLPMPKATYQDIDTNTSVSVSVEDQLQQAQQQIAQLQKELEQYQDPSDVMDDREDLIQELNDSCQQQSTMQKEMEEFYQQELKFQRDACQALKEQLEFKQTQHNKEIKEIKKQYESEMKVLAEQNNQLRVKCASAEREFAQLNPSHEQDHHQKPVSAPVRHRHDSVPESDRTNKHIQTTRSHQVAEEKKDDTSVVSTPTTLSLKQQTSLQQELAMAKTACMIQDRIVNGLLLRNSQQQNSNKDLSPTTQRRIRKVTTAVNIAQKNTEDSALFALKDLVLEGLLLGFSHSTNSMPDHRDELCEQSCLALKEELNELKSTRAMKDVIINGLLLSSSNAVSYAEELPANAAPANDGGRTTQQKPSASRLDRVRQRFFFSKGAF